DLHDKGEDEGAPPNIAPARTAGDAFVERLVHQSRDACAIFQPRHQGFHARGFFSGVAIWKFWYSTHTAPSRTSQLSVSMSRGLGLGAGSIRAPVRSNMLVWQGHAKQSFSAEYGTRQPAWGQVEFSANISSLFGWRISWTEPTGTFCTRVQASSRAASMTGNV